MAARDNLRWLLWLVTDAQHLPSRKQLAAGLGLTQKELD